MPIHPDDADLRSARREFDAAHAELVAARDVPFERDRREAFKAAVAKLELVQRWIALVVERRAEPKTKKKPQPQPKRKSRP